MDEQKKEHYKQLLLNEKRQHDNTLNDMKGFDMGEQDKYSPTELSNYDNHPADMGSEVYEAEHGKALQVHEEHFIKDVDDALQRLENGTFGKCAFCGKDIDEDRLEVVPSARLCIECEEDKEITMEFLRNNRPIEEKAVWDAPFGRKYLNKQEDDEHEGMDQLKDLMKYGSADSPQDLGGYHDYKEFYTNEVDKQGIVDDMDQVTNEEYEAQLPD